MAEEDLHQLIFMRVALQPDAGGKYQNSYMLVQGFWKGWHVSFNQWLVRYIYVPLGGSSLRLLNIWLIFTFVALW